MESITLGQVAETLAWIVGIGGSVYAIYKAFKSTKDSLSKLIVKELEPIKESLVKMDEKIDKVDMESCKNFLVRYLADIEQGKLPDEIERQRFWEQYDHYEKAGGNSYIHQKVEKLKGKELL